VTVPRASRGADLDGATARSVVARLEKDEGVAREAAERSVTELLKFLDLAAEMTANGDDRALIPSAKVDAAWHAFILHTRPYTEFCERRYGEYLHHDVTPPKESVTAREVFEYARTRVLIERRYGDLDEELWPLP
jgi:hypothetical protein